VRCRFGVSGFDQHRRASCGVTSIDVFRTVADQKGAGQEQPMLGRGIWKQTGTWFPARPIVGIIMEADEDVVV
jgi:hypothetical protein